MARSPSWKTAVSRTVHERHGVSEVPALALLAVGAMLIQVAMFEGPEAAALTENVWFNVGLGAVFTGVVLAFAIPIL